jgi:hypothetical protein
LVLIIAAAAIGSAITQYSSRASSVEPTPAPQVGGQWEYCTVSKANYPGSPRAGVYWITYFQSTGFKVIDVEDNFTTNAALAKAFARLGAEGWELVDQGTLEVRNTKLDAWYFKRPKQ